MPAPNPIPFPEIEQTEGSRPMGRRSSRVFVLVTLFIMIVSAAVMAVYLVRTAEQNSARIGTQNDNRSAVPGFGVTNAGDQ